jgi:arsenate reductase-like glutaredoxin family protein
LNEKQTVPTIKIYGAKRCHKTQFYINLLDETKLQYSFLDVETNEDHALELRGLYAHRKLNFPAITIGSKKLRNPSIQELKKWLKKLIPNH